MIRHQSISQSVIHLSRVVRHPSSVASRRFNSCFHSFIGRSIDHRIESNRIARHAPAVLGTTSARSYRETQNQSPSFVSRPSISPSSRIVANHHRESSASFDTLRRVETHRHLDAAGRLTADLDVEVAHGVGHVCSSTKRGWLVGSFVRSFVRSRPRALESVVAVDGCGACTIGSMIPVIDRSIASAVGGGGGTGRGER